MTLGSSRKTPIAAMAGALAKLNKGACWRLLADRLLRPTNRIERVAVDQFLYLAGQHRDAHHRLLELPAALDG
jgi:hypothetical protein